MGSGEDHSIVPEFVGLIGFVEFMTLRVQFLTFLEDGHYEWIPRLKHAINFSAGIRKDVHAHGKSVGKIIWDA